MENETEMEIRILRRSKSIAEDPSAGARKRDRENGRQLAQEHASTMLLMAIAIAGDASEDTKNRIACIKYVCDRAWGTPKAEQGEDPKMANKAMLDILAMVSADRAAIEHAERVKALEAQPIHPAARIDLTSEYELLVADSDQSAHGQTDIEMPAWSDDDSPR